MPPELEAAPAVEVTTTESAPTETEAIDLGDDGGETDPVESAIAALNNLGNDTFPDDKAIESDKIPAEMKGETDGLEATEETAPEAEKGVGLDLDKINERERAIWKERKKHRDEITGERTRVQELEAKIAALEAAPPKKEINEPVDEEDVETDEMDDLISELMGKKKPGETLTEERVREMLQEVRDKEATESQEEITKMEQEEALDDFNEEIKTFVKDNDAEFPLIGATGSEELIGEVISQDYLAKAEEYGEEYALAHTISNKEAAGKVQKHLESQVQEMLKSESMRKIVRQFLGAHGNSETSSHQSPGTITEDFSSTTGSGELDEDERTRRAIAALS